jgi:hypothetical protein
MRRYLAVGVAFPALATLAVGCGGSTPQNLSSKRTVSTTELAPADRRESGHAIGDTVTLGSGSVTVVSVEDNVDAGRLFAPPRGSRYVAAQVRGCAGPTEAGVAFHPAYFALRLADHTEHDGDSGVKKPALRPDTIHPGGCSDGWVSFVVPSRATPSAVVYHGSDDVTWTLRQASTSPSKP